MKTIASSVVIFALIVTGVIAVCEEVGHVAAQAVAETDDSQELFQTECPYCHAPINQVPVEIKTNSVTHSEVGMKTIIARTSPLHCPVCNRDFTAHSDIWIADAMAKSIRMPSRKKLQMSMPPIPAMPMVVRTNASVIIAPSGRTFEARPLSSFSMEELADTYTTNSAGTYLVRIVPTKQ